MTVYRLARPDTVARFAAIAATVALLGEVMDIGTTLYGLSHLGAVELNPVLNGVGMLPFFAAKLAYGPLAVVVIAVLRPPRVRWYLIAVAVAAWLPPLWNLATVSR